MSVMAVVRAGFAWLAVKLLQPVVLRFSRALPGPFNLVPPTLRSCTTGAVYLF